MAINGTSIKTTDRMAIEFAVRNGLPCPKFIRARRLSKPGAWEEQIRLTAIGQWKADGSGGSYRLLVDYLDAQADMGPTWVSHDRSIRLVTVKVTGPYVWNGTRDLALPLPPKFWAGAINNCEHIGVWTGPDGSVVCASCGMDPKSLELRVEFVPEGNAVELKSRGFRWRLRTGGGEKLAYLVVEDWRDELGCNDPNVTVETAISVLNQLASRGPGARVSWKIFGSDEFVLALPNHEIKFTPDGDTAAILNQLVR